MVFQCLRPDGVGDPLFLEGALSVCGGHRLTPIIDRSPHSMRDLLSTRVWETDVQYALSIAACHCHSSINGLEHIRLDQFSLTQDSYSRAIAVEQVAVLYKLLKLDFCHFHQAIHFVFRSLEVLDAEGVDRDMRDACLVAYLQYSCQRFESQIMTGDSLHPVVFGKATVAIHNECDMFRYGTLSKSADEQFPQLIDRPFGGR